MTVPDGLVRTPALLGGPPVFDRPVHIVAPRLPKLSVVGDKVEQILATGQLTNNSRYVREFEAAVGQRLGVEAIAISNATIALVLVLKGLGVRGEVILPSFTYCASAHAVAWAGAAPVFADILPTTFTLDPAAVEAAITPRTSAILAVHIYGHPCEVDELAAVARAHRLPLVFDSAHAFGSAYKGRQVGGFGAAEVFSLHATKLLPVGEGGCVATSDSRLAAYLRDARRFGDPGDENTRFAGTNGKMQEFNAILGLAGLDLIDRHIANRRKYASYLRDRLGCLPGLRFQHIEDHAFTTFQNFAVLVDQGRFGLSRDQVSAALAAENVRCRKYFYPPVHEHDAVPDRRVAKPACDRRGVEKRAVPAVLLGDERGSPRWPVRRLRNHPRRGTAAARASRLMRPREAIPGA